MEEEKTALGRWLMEATRAIRFAPDRRAVEAELRAHIEDKTADLMRIFPSLPQEEARDMALAQMGDAAEIGQALAKIHKPWLGWLWRASQVMLWTLVVVLLLMAWNGLDLWPGFVEQSYFSKGVEEFVQVAIGPGATRTDLKKPATVTVGEYTFTVDTLWQWTAPEPSAASGKRCRSVYVILDVEHRLPWETVNLSSYLWAEDDRGNRVESWRYWNDAAEKRPWGEMILSRKILNRGPFRERYEFLVHVKDESADMLYLRYDRMGADLTIPLVLEEAVP